MTGLDAPAGDPVALDDAVHSLHATEQALEQAARDIASTLADGAGQAIGAMTDRGGRASHALAAAHARYRGARTALRDYAVELHRFHRDAHAAMDLDDAAMSQWHHARYRQDHARAALREAALNPHDPATRDLWQREYDHATQAVDHAQRSSAEAHSRYAAAQERLDDAAQEAMGRIVAAFDGTNDDWRDYLAEGLAFVTHLIDEVADWATAFFAEVMELVADAVALYLTAVLVAAAAIMVAVVLVQLLVTLEAVVAAIIVTAIVMILAVLAELLLLMAVGKEAMSIADALGLEGVERIRFVMLALAAACPPLALFIQSRIQDELSKPTPEVRRLDAATLTSSQRDARDSLDASAPSDVADLLTWAGQVDTIGGDSQAVVDIARVVDESGEVSWIVTLPSTADWVVAGDKGAPNDLDADLMLILFPELRTQYESAVLDAMAKAGIPPGDPVVLTGWSLGGIMGGSLIESGAGGYHYTGLVCAGSPIDHMAIAPDVPVVQVKHTLDPVHRADLIDSVPDTAHHVSLWDGPASHGASTDLKTGNLVGHDNGDYVDTLDDHLAYRGLHGGLDLNDDFAAVLPWDDPNTPQHVRVEHTQYAFHE